MRRKPLLAYVGSSRVVGVDVSTKATDRLQLASCAGERDAGNARPREDDFAVRRQRGCDRLDCLFVADGRFHRCVGCCHVVVHRNPHGAIDLRHLSPLIVAGRLDCPARMPTHINTVLAYSTCR